MNKRQKKKREKKIAWAVGYDKYIEEQQKLDKELDYNGEGYADKTAGVAIRRAMQKGY